MKVKSLRRLAVVLVAFASGVLLGKGNSEFWISLLQLVAVLFIFSYDLAVEDENIKRRRKFREIQGNSTVGKEIGVENYELFQSY